MLLLLLLSGRLFSLLHARRLAVERRRLPRPSAKQRHFPYGSKEPDEQRSERKRRLSQGGPQDARRPQQRAPHRAAQRQQLASKRTSFVLPGKLLKFHAERNSSSSNCRLFRALSSLSDKQTHCQPTSAHKGARQQQRQRRQHNNNNNNNARQLQLQCQRWRRCCRRSRLSALVYDSGGQTGAAFVVCQIVALAGEWRPLSNSPIRAPRIAGKANARPSFAVFAFGNAKRKLSRFGALSRQSAPLNLELGQTQAPPAARRALVESARACAQRTCARLSQKASLGELSEGCSARS